MPTGGLSTAGIGISGTVAPRSRVGLMAGLGFPSPDVSSEDGLLSVGAQISTVENNSRILEAKHIAPFESNKGHAWSAFKQETGQHASLYEFGSGLVRNPPVFVNPLNEPELLRLGVFPDDIKRARFAYILLINTVKDSVGKRIVFKSRSRAMPR